GRAVAGSDVVALTVERRGVVDLEEEREDVAVRRLGGVEDDLHSLGVAGVVTVGRVRVLASGVADSSVEHAGLAADEVFHSPEASAGKNSRLGAGCAGDGAGVSHVHSFSLFKSDALSRSGCHSGGTLRNGDDQWMLRTQLPRP